MTIHQLILIFFALSVVVATLVVAGRLAWCSVGAFQARLFRTALLALAGLFGIFTLLATVLFVWILLAASHLPKEINDPYTLMAVSGIPFFLAAFGLWRLAARLQATLPRASAPPAAPSNAAR